MCPVLDRLFKDIVSAVENIQRRTRLENDEVRTASIVALAIKAVRTSETSVSIVSGYGLDDRAIEVRLPVTDL
jgi:hypothetical protein